MSTSIFWEKYEKNILKCHLMKVLSSMLSVNFYFRSTDDTGTTPVHIAAMWGEPDCLQILLANGGDPFLEDQVCRYKINPGPVTEPRYTLPLQTV